MDSSYLKTGITQSLWAAWKFRWEEMCQSRKHLTLTNGLESKGKLEKKSQEEQIEQGGRITRYLRIKQTNKKNHTVHGETHHIHRYCMWKNTYNSNNKNTGSYRTRWTGIYWPCSGDQTYCERWNIMLSRCTRSFKGPEILLWVMKSCNCFVLFFFSWGIFLYFLFFLCSYHWFEVGGTQLAKNTMSLPSLHQPGFNNNWIQIWWLSIMSHQTTSKSW